MSTPLAHACCARLPLRGLPALGALRARPGLRVRRTEEALWVFWPAGDESTARHLQTLDGAELFCLEGDLWYRPGAALPTFGIPPADEGVSLAGLLSPEPAVPQHPAPGSWQPARLSLVAEAPRLTPGTGEPGSPRTPPRRHGSPPQAT